ncbi:MAG: NAD(P)H-hydrate dehydratase [Candidatus Magasanikbacteria bacterium RIFCSPHIGHO2_02_FULL_47_14]|uniref:ADP-dependent (S)-NAD(P)H-hydrate dehydratase n=1 Tax=Candidatus Magasanikbacteria bacterium RIFCSPHIGHO2_02_FULL_47_14 TaxID=1798680 RepID=A0A1F6MAS4_9BACT|nr:MAG: NAD(P)H-hydrate dehydratase [Candidatus Magasanikbacteria bacterium RIFCSPHIGHO2_02_FULL_47_14]
MHEIHGRITGPDILSHIRRPETASHKGQNGRLLIIAGSEKYHGSLLLAMQIASRIVDTVYVFSSKNNVRLLERLRERMAAFIAVFEEELWQTVELVDAILIGPGLAEDDGTHQRVKKLLTEYRDKKTVIDATALWHVDPNLLHEQCIVTPHSREFSHVFGCEPSAVNVLAMAKQYTCTIVLKGRIDYISNGQKVYENHTGNVGMTKGGTGDVLAGTTAAFAATNDLLVSALAGVYLNGLAGDRLFERVGTLYNAEDVMKQLGTLWKEYI